MILIVLISLIAIIATESKPCAQIGEYTLNNGLKVIISQTHDNPLVSFQIYYRVGSRNDPEGKSGLSHYLEHMMFKGTSKHGPLEFVRTTLKEGGISNASTFENFTVYFQNTPSDKIGTSIEMEADRMNNLTIDARQAATEKEVVKEERRKRIEDNPRNALDEAFTRAAYTTHPYRNPVIGEMTEIDSITKDDLYNYYKRYYSPANAFIVIAGDVNPDDTMAMITKHFGPLDDGQKNNETPRHEPRQIRERATALARKAEMPYLIMGYHTPGMPHAESYGIRLLATILAQGKSSRLYESLVHKKRLAIDTEIEYNAMTADPAILKIRVAPLPNTNMARLKKEICDELDKIKRRPPTQRELQRAKNQIGAAFTFAQDDLHARAGTIALFELMGDWKLTNTYIQHINAVTAKDVQKLSRKYLTRDNRTTAILTPESSGRSPKEAR